MRHGVHGEGVSEGWAAALSGREGVVGLALGLVGRPDLVGRVAHSHVLLLDLHEGRLVGCLLVQPVAAARHVEHTHAALVDVAVVVVMPVGRNPWTLSEQGGEIQAARGEGVRGGRQSEVGFSAVVIRSSSISSGNSRS